MSFFKKNKALFPVSFATSCWERDWVYLLKDPSYLKIKQIGNQLFPFSRRILLINNVKDLDIVVHFAEKKKKEGVLTDYYVSKEHSKRVLQFFQLNRKDFVGNEETPSEWVYWNAIGVFSAIYFCKTPYLLYHTGDTRIEKKVNWIPLALKKMNEKPKYKVANLIWNRKKKEAKKESYCSDGSFFVSRQGFSDQQFLVKTEDFRQPIYNKLREDTSYYPRGDVWERRVLSHMKNQNWERIIYKKGFYIHQNF